MASTNNRLSYPVALHRKREDVAGKKPFIAARRRARRLRELDREVEQETRERERG